MLSRLSTLTLLPFFLSACLTTQPKTVTESVVELPPPEENSGELDFDLGSGTYFCENDIMLEVARVNEAEQSKLYLRWKKKPYTLIRDGSESGLPRFESEDGALVWIDLPWKSVLLDGKTQKPIVNECKKQTLEEHAAEKKKLAAEKLNSQKKPHKGKKKPTKKS